MLSHLFRASVVTAIVAGAALTAASPGSAAQPPFFGQRPAVSGYYVYPNSTCKWHVVASADPFADQNALSSVSAGSSRDAWTVGSTFDPSSGNTELLAEHWNGTAWSISAAVDPGGVSAFLNGVVEITPTDVWAVGSFYDPGTGHFHTLAEHWDGSSWTAFPTPNPGPLSQSFTAVAANSTNDVWAVGQYRLTPGGNRATITEHWNGTAWSVVPSPNMGTDDTVFASVVANGPKNVWADGGYNCITGICQTLTERWNGIKWKIVPSPDLGTSSNAINTMTSSGGTDVWAIGDYYTGTTFNTLTLHWRGTAWSVVPSANMGFTAIIGSTSVNANNVWAVGEWQNGSIFQPFSMNWNGTTWTAVPAPTVGTTGSILVGAGRIPGTTTIWGVGESLNSDGTPHQTLVEKFHC